MTLQNVIHHHLPDHPIFLKAILGDISACDSCVDPISTGILSKHLLSARNPTFFSTSPSMAEKISTGLSYLTLFHRAFP
jgi:hypothetical protein